MNFFEEAALRLKQQLQVKTDKDVAEALGLSAVAWVGRKKRDNFPEVELYALAAKRPDLKINVEYVLTGRATQAMTPEGRDNYLAGQLVVLEAMVQALLLTHPSARKARDAFVQLIDGVKEGVAGESLPEDFERGMRAAQQKFLLLPSDAPDPAAKTITAKEAGGKKVA